MKKRNIHTTYFLEEIALIFVLFLIGYMTINRCWNSTSPTFSTHFLINFPFLNTPRFIKLETHEAVLHIAENGLSDV